MDELAKLFGSQARLKALRLFFFNPTELYDRDDVAARLRLVPATASRELTFLSRAGVIRKKMTYKDANRSNKRGKPARKRIAGWMLNERFIYLDPLRRFLIDTAALSGKEVAQRLRGVGRLRLVITSGIFMQLWDSRLDMLIVGDRFKESTLAQTIKSFEAELGRELRYAVLTTDDFTYRYSIQDKLIRDVLDYPHEAVIDLLGIGV